MRPTIERVIRRYHDRLTKDAHHRYRSWGHCYRHFRRRTSLRAQPDLGPSALQLGFYLASWGMYRGSSFLLQKDFQIHRRVVRALQRDQYDWLLGYRPGSARTNARAIHDILALVETIREAYCDHIRVVDGQRCQIEVSDTLATKIVLGTLACMPARDEFVVEGLRLERILPYTTLTQQSLEALFEWYRSHEAEFRAVQHRLRENGLRYPPMKLVDMYLCERGRRSR